MSTLLERSDQAISTTEVSRSTKPIMDRLQRGKQDKYDIMRNNAPAAVMMSVQHYEALMDSIDDLKLELQASERLNTLEKSTLISHDDMIKKFES